MATGPQCINLKIDFHFAAALRSHPCTQSQSECVCVHPDPGSKPAKRDKDEASNACGFLIEIGDCAWAVFAVGSGNLTTSWCATRQFNTLPENAPRLCSDSDDEDEDKDYSDAATLTFACRVLPTAGRGRAGQRGRLQQMWSGKCQGNKKISFKWITTMGLYAKKQSSLAQWDRLKIYQVLLGIC